jgi:DNA-binding transcriptional LysR family regulator
MPTARDVLTPDSLAMLQVIAETGSFAAAARQLRLVPSALTYRVRQMEEALDVLLFDRSARQAQPTEAGQALLSEGNRLLQDIDAVAHRVRRVATGWEPELTIMADGVISQSTLFDLVERFYALGSPTKLKLSTGTLTGPIECLTTGRADLVMGLAASHTSASGLQQQDLGDITFAFAVAPFHPLAQAPEPINDEMLQPHRLVVVADSAQKDRTSMGLLDGQDIFTVDTIQSKINAQVRGLGCGFLPQAIITPYVAAGLLVTKEVTRATRHVRMRYAWKKPSNGMVGKALQWWLEQLDSPVTQQALLSLHQLPAQLQTHKP